MIDKFMSADDAVALISDGDTVALIGGGGGMMEADAVFSAIERRFLNTGHPRDLTCTHALGIGDKGARGMNRFAHEGMVRRVIGGHWVWSPNMQELARQNKIEAYCLPGGVCMQLMREIGAGRPGLISRIGLETFVDPRHGGGKMNESATEDLVETIEIDGETWLRYKPFRVDVAIIRGSRADRFGNITLEHEAARVDVFAVALAAHNSGGKVIVQVRERAGDGEIAAHSVVVPAPFVDAIVLVPDQPMSHECDFDAAMSGEVQVENGSKVARSGSKVDVRSVIAARAAMELRDGAVVNFGFGIPDAVAQLVSDRGDRGRYYQTIEHGTYGGELLTGALFGFARYPTAMIDGPSQFDFYGGGGLDIAFLGFGEIDRHGNVNASRLGGVTVGPGGFIDISQSARTMVFCGTFDAKGAEIEIATDAVTILRHGSIPKIVAEVDQVTFSGRRATVSGQRVLYVTERAVFDLRADGLTLIEIAPGIDLQRDVLDQIGFPINVAEQVLRTPTTVYTDLGSPS